MRLPLGLRRKIKKKRFRKGLTEPTSKKGVDYTGKYYTKDKDGIIKIHNSPVPGSKPLIDTREPAEQNVELPAYKTNIRADRETNLKMNWIRNEEVNVVDNPTIVRRITADQRYANNPENIERKIREIKEREEGHTAKGHGKKRYKFEMADPNWRERREAEKKRKRMKWLSK